MLDNLDLFVGIYRDGISIETLLQPKWRKKVSTKQSPARGEVVWTTKYVLTHQNLDAQGEIITDLVKVIAIFIGKESIQISSG